MDKLRVVDFVAAMPTTNSEVVKLRNILGSFDSLRRRVRSAEKLFLCNTENQDRLAEEQGVDRFMVEDLIAVLLDPETSLDFADFIDQGFWTRGRYLPRFGIPWGSVVFCDANRSVELLVRHAGSFAVEDEDPPQWITCPVVSTGDMSYENLTKLVLNFGTIDIWWKLGTNNIAGKLVFR